MNKVVQYYEIIEEDARFSRNSRRIEFLTSTAVLDSIIPEQAKILDVGAGSGAYSFYYVDKQHEVVAVDLTPKHVELIKQKSREKDIPIEAYVEDATDLSRFASESFDVVLCLGPMYHLTSRSAERSAWMNV